MAAERDIKRETLANYRITYDEDPASRLSEELPERVAILCEGLLSSEGRLIEYVENLREDERKSIPANVNAYISIQDEPLEIIGKLSEQAELALLISRKAQSLSADNVMEKRWESLLFNTVFKNLEEKVPPASGYWNEYNLGSDIVLGTDHTWNEDHNIPKASYSGNDLTAPKPDIYLGFPMKNSPNVNPCGFWRDSSVQNFSIDVLGRLLNKGLVCTPTTGVRRYLDKRARQLITPKKNISNRIESDGQQQIDAGAEGEQSFSKDHLLCFPWAVVELKHENVSPAEVTKCYCQGANAASRALRIFGNLSRYWETEVDGQQVPPVVVLTFIGPRFKLWIAFSTLDSEGITSYKMVCIEERAIDTFWGALRLCQIVDDMSFWATRILKPRISMCIDQWRSRHMDSLRHDLSRDSKISALVQKIEHRERELGLPRASNLAETIRLALIIGEISSNGPGSTSQQESEPPSTQRRITVRLPPANSEPHSLQTVISPPNPTTRDSETRTNKPNVVPSTHLETPIRPRHTKTTSHEERPRRRSPRDFQSTLTNIETMATAKTSRDGTDEGLSLGTEELPPAVTALLLGRSLGSSTTTVSRVGGSLSTGTTSKQPPTGPARPTSSSGTSLIPSIFDNLPSERTGGQISFLESAPPAKPTTISPDTSILFTKPSSSSSGSLFTFPASTPPAKPAATASDSSTPFTNPSFSSTWTLFGSLSKAPSPKPTFTFSPFGQVSTQSPRPSSSNSDGLSGTRGISPAHRATASLGSLSGPPGKAATTPTESSSTGPSTTKGAERLGGVSASNTPTPNSGSIFSEGTAGTTF